MKPAYIHHIATATPSNSYRQEDVREIMKEHVSDRRAVKSVLHRIYTQSGIETRYCVFDDFKAGGSSRLFYDPDTRTIREPGTQERNDLYIRHSKELFTKLGRDLIDAAAGVEPKDITHVITVSCTGFYAPGPDYFVVRDLGLRPETERYHIGFMGCYAAFPALRMARSFCESHPDAVVLVLCVELCTLHLRFDEKTDHMISASVFADGGAGALVSAKKPVNSPAFEITSLHTALTSEGEQDMAWTIGDTGFSMELSTYVPDIINRNLAELLNPALQKNGITAPGVDHWAVHPGGRAIVDKVQASCEIPDHKITSSRNVLRDYGNMSSATILFVLKDVLSNGITPGDKTLAMAFGPGLTVETGILTAV
ncbi:MAG: type III polyketide synthase [Balneolaceae bacterium]|nr:MAG: type III polyketide synthase [Balneolaceae bacterium]